jgi:hypothetical protein
MIIKSEHFRWSQNRGFIADIETLGTIRRGFEIL